MRLFLPEAAADTLLCLPGDEATAEAVFARMTQPAALLSIPVDWSHDLSPWRAERVFHAGEDFTGGAEAFLQRLLGAILPDAEAAIPWPVRQRGIAGYSLAGLFALWAAMQTDSFSLCASMSGSLWFDGFMPWAMAQPCHAERVYLSVGDREARTRNLRMAPVEACTREMAAGLAAARVNTAFVLERGGHFDNVPERIARGLDWLMQA